MGLINNIIDFVFPIQRRLYHPTGRFIRKPVQFRSPNIQRRFARNRLWSNLTRNSLQRNSSQRVYSFSNQQFRRPLERKLTQTPMPMQVRPAQKKSFWSEMFSPNINPPSMKPQQKRKGFGNTTLNLIRWNNMLRR